MNDSKRLEALRDTGLLDSQPEESFDRLTRIAATLLRAPVALFSLVDDHRQFFKSQIGLAEPWASARETPLTHSFCQHVVTSEKPLIIGDAREHDLVRGNLAIPDLGVIAYAGMPIDDAAGNTLGSFCVIDTQPRAWTETEVRLLEDIAESVKTELQLRTDIRNRERIEAALRASEERYRDLVEAASDIIYRTDEYGRFIYVNPVAEKVMEFPSNILLGMHFTHLVSAEAKHETEAFYRTQFRERIETTYYEFPATTGSGRRIWLGQNVRLLLEGDRITGAQAVARNVTSRRELDLVKDELLSIVSHELRTPLTSLRGSLGLLASGRLSTEQTKRMIDIAVHDTDRLVRLINDFLDLERIKSGRATLNVIEIDLADIIESALRSVDGHATARRIDIEVTVRNATVRVDADRLVQVVVNLLSNAIKFSESDSYVTVHAHRTDDELSIEVTDRGRGIPRAELEAVFQPFHQVDASDSREKGGSGLGLPICKSIVEQHGGTIGLYSEPGKGTMCRVRIPQ